jgi:hypothetical protein
MGPQPYIALQVWTEHRADSAPSSSSVVPEVGSAFSSQGIRGYMGALIFTYFSDYMNNVLLNIIEEFL